MSNNESTKGEIVMYQPDETSASDLLNNIR